MNAQKRQIDISATQEMRKSRVLKVLARPIFLTRLGMLAERLTRAFWPLWSLAFLVYAALSFGVIERVAPLWAQGGALALALLAVVLLLAGLWRFRWPDRIAAADRLDRSLAGRPLSPCGTIRRLAAPTAPLKAFGARIWRGWKPAPPPPGRCCPI